MGKTKIEYADYTINPIIGCKHGCPYCYAKRMNDRFHFVREWDEPENNTKWVIQLGKIKKPSIIFIGSMCDLFGDWITDIRIRQVLGVCGENPQHKFLFLTKNPKRYAEFDFPENCWKGATITTRDEIGNVKYVDFVSVEPLMDNLGIYHFGNIKWLIVGGMTPLPMHEKEWVDNFISWGNRFGVPIFLKNNLHYPKVLQEYPKELKGVL